MRDTGLLRTALICVVLIAIGAGLIIELGPNHAIGLMRLKVVNDTAQAVKIQPCWDIDCIDVNGLPPTVIQPHKASRVASTWANDLGNQITIGVLKLNKSAPAFDSCVVQYFPPGVKVGIFRVSSQVEVPCPHVPEGGGVG